MKPPFLIFSVTSSAFLPSVHTSEITIFVSLSMFLRPISPWMHHWISVIQSCDWLPPWPPGCPRREFPSIIEGVNQYFYTLSIDFSLLKWVYKRFGLIKWQALWPPAHLWQGKQQFPHSAVRWKTIPTVPRKDLDRQKDLDRPVQAFSLFSHWIVPLLFSTQSLISNRKSIIPHEKYITTMQLCVHWIQSIFIMCWFCMLQL